MSEIRLLKSAVAVDVARLLVALAGGIRFSSIGLAALAFDYLGDLLTSLASYKLVSKSRAPPDETHHYGHLKYEALSGALVTSYMLASILAVLYIALTEAGEFKASYMASTAALLLLLLTVAKAACYRAAGSTVGFTTQLRNAASDILESIIVLFTVTLGMYSPLFDLAGGLAVAGVLSAAVYRSYREVEASLTDASPGREVIEEMYSIALSTPGVKGAHKLRARLVSGRIFVDLHIQTSPELPVKEAHDIATEVAKEIKSRVRGVVDVVVHIEPEEPEASQQASSHKAPPR